MAKYKCNVCGFIYDEAKEGKPFAELDVCPVCKRPAAGFTKLEEEPAAESVAAASAVPPAPAAKAEPATPSLAYDPQFARHDTSNRYMAEIHEMAVSGKSIIGAMGTKMQMPNWDDILILGAQLNPAPLLDEEEVCTTVVIGKNAKRPLVAENPIFVTHMSFGALSRETKIALAKATAMAGSVEESGEGGIVPEEMAAAKKFIFEYIPNKYSVTKENLQKVDAIEIKIGQGTKPGMGGHLPGEKVTPEIAAIRGFGVGEDIHSPSKFPEIKTKEDIKDMVAMLRTESDGRPIGIKIAAGRIERVRLRKFRREKRQNHELGDAVAGRDGARRVRIVVQRDGALAAVIGVDHANAVGWAQPLLRGQPAAREHAAEIPRRDGEREARADHGRRVRRDGDALSVCRAGVEVIAGGVRAAAAGRHGAGAQLPNLYFHPFMPSQSTM